jgi:hypothetical protein
MFLDMFLVFDIQYHCIHYQVRHGGVGLKVGNEISIFLCGFDTRQEHTLFYMDIFKNGAQTCADDWVDICTDSWFPHVRLLYHGSSYWSLMANSIKYVCRAWIPERGYVGDVSTITHGHGNSIICNVGRRMIFWDVSFKVNLCLGSNLRCSHLAVW